MQPLNRHRPGSLGISILNSCRLIVSLAISRDGLPIGVVTLLCLAIDRYSVTHTLLPGCYGRHLVQLERSDLPLVLLTLLNVPYLCLGQLAEVLEV